MNRIINMVLRQLTRQLVRRGVNSGLNYMTKRGKKSAAKADPSKPVPNNAKQNRRAMRIMRRFGRF
ncbi:hypothetical protein [Litoreibacter roseus]|uniref:Uncharacterized protein n=1 Tax=Litoreibacter roseus TaxID=2601869 RepID=A0A6N6JEH2_9RHOB|nr:hypothetical protein [Litoreibacter roseus]GFE63612.1 hypothetical protein KIN_06860 [Litoreibacter roseus]